MPELRRLAGVWVLLAATVLFAGLVLGRYGWTVAAFGLLYAALATSWNWMRATGLFSLGQVAFFGTGALTEAWFTTAANLPPWLALLLAAIAGAIVALPLLPALRMTPSNFALATLAYAVLLKGLVSNLPALGPQGFLLPVVRDFSGPDPLLIAALAALAAGLSLGYHAFLGTRAGRAAAALRQAPQAAQACGIDLIGARWVPFAGNAAATAVAGALYAHLVGSVEPIVVFAPFLSVLPLVLGMVGGALNPLGGMIGTLALYPLDELVLRPALPQAHAIGYGLALVVLLMLRPAGLLGARIPAVPAGRGQAAHPLLNIACDHLTVKRYGTIVLSDVSLNVASGQILRVIGPNGAGKSSLLLALAGVLPVKQGAVRFNGTPVPRSLAGRARSGLALTFQAPQPFTEWTVGENVAIAAERAGAPAEVASILEALELTALQGRPAGQLSAGEGKRLELARALALRPAILILDEPLAGLSPEASHRITHVITRVRDRGAAIVWVEHRYAVGQAADQLLVLEDGRVSFYGAPTEFEAHQRGLLA